MNNPHRLQKAGMRISDGQALEKIIEKPAGRSLSTNSNTQYKPSLNNVAAHKGKVAPGGGAPSGSEVNN